MKKFKDYTAEEINNNCIGMYLRSIHPSNGANKIVKRPINPIERNIYIDSRNDGNPYNAGAYWDHNYEPIEQYNSKDIENIEIHLDKIFNPKLTINRSRFELLDLD